MTLLQLVEAECANHESSGACLGAQAGHFLGGRPQPQRATWTRLLWSPVGSDLPEK